jgi:hypothetical protein
MKKITLLFFTLLLSVTSWRVSGQYFSDGFEGTFPSPWTHVQTNTAETWASTTVSFHSGAQSIQCDYDAALGLQNEVMMSPVINLSASTAPQVSFWFLMSYYWGVDPNDNYDLKVEGTTDGGATSTVLWTESAQGVFTNWTWYQVTVPLTAFVGQSNFQLILRYEGSDGAQGNFDDIVVAEAPTCPAPAALTATGVTSSSAVLGWTAGGTEPAWNIQYGPTGFTLGSGTIVNGVTNPYTLSGLSASTTFQYYVQAACGGTAGNSTWVGPLAFTTACAPIAALPWNEGFETAANPALPNCWFKENGDWVTAINSGSTFDADAHTGTKFLRDSWSATNEYIWTPGFDLVAGTSYDFSFWWAGDTYAGWQGDIFYNTTQLSTGATQMGGSFVVLTDVTTKTYAQAIRTFIPSTSGTYYFAIRANCPTATPWYLSVDDFKLEVTPACPAPTDLTASSITTNSASLGWTSSATSFNVEYGLSGFTQGTGTVANGVTNPYTANSLTPASVYQYYVQAVCGTSSISSWAGPFTFTTACDNSDIPYGLDFEEVSVPALPLCTENVNEGTGNNWLTASAPGSGFTTIALRYSYSGTNDANTWFFTNGLNLVGGTSYRLEFDYGNNSTTYEESLKVAFGTSKTGAAMTNVISDYPSIGDATLHHAILDFTPSSSGVYYVGFQAYSIADQWNLFVDNILIDLTPACPQPLDLELVSTTSSSATISWTAGASETLWNIEYGEMGFGLGTGTSVSGVTNPYTISGLTSNTAYDVYVQSDCTTSGVSTWTGPLSFQTACASLPLPYGNDFDTDADCWTIENSNEDARAWQFLTNATEISCISGTGDYALGVLYNTDGVTSMDDWLFSPAFDLTSGTSYTLEFSYGNDGGTTYLENMSVFLATANNSTAGFAGTELLSAVNISGGCTPFSTTTLTVPTTGTYYVAFYGYSDADQDVLLVDDFYLYESTIGIADHYIDGFAMYPNPANNILSLKALNNIDNIQIYNMLGQEVMDVNPSATQVELDVTGLSNGTYVVKVQAGSQLGSYSLIKQ